MRNSDGSFYLCPSKKDFYSPSTVQLTLRLAELGWLFNTIHGFIEHSGGQKDLGLVGQSLVTGLREELADYYRLLSLLEDQLKAGLLKNSSEFPEKYLDTYSGGQLRRDGKNVSFCVSATTEIMKTNNVPLKSPIKLLPEMKKIFLKCSKFVGFRDLF